MAPPTSAIASFLREGRRAGRARAERIVGVAGGEHEQLGIEPLERLLQLLLTLHLHDHLDRVSQLDVVVSGSDDARVTGRAGRRQDRQAARGADRVDVQVGEERLRPAGLGPLRLLGPGHDHDQRDPVTLGDRLAQTSGAGHAFATLPIVATVSVVRARLAIALLLAALPAVASAAARPTIFGTVRADFLAGRDGSDRIIARSGDDRISAEYDGGVDLISCGPGRDVVAVDARDRVEGDCEVVSKRIHRDRQTNADSQHESQVEPDSLTVGATTVALFQNGRNRAGGAASIAFATSRDSGRTWREGILPGLTATSVPPGPSTRASDPTLAYDALHGVWLANTLAIAPDATRLTIHRSRDGVAWTGPIDAARAPAADIAYDKNWLTCDNGAASPFRGRCYLAYTLVGEQEGEDDLAVQHSVDGGVTWSAAATVHIPVTGVIPVVQPNGTLTLVFWSPRTGMVAVRSTDGGVTLGPPATIATFGSRTSGRSGRRRFRRPSRRHGPGHGCLAGLPVSLGLSGERHRLHTVPRRNDLVAARSRHTRPKRGHADDRRGARHRPARDRVLRDPAGRRGRGARDLSGRHSWSAPQRLNPRRMAFAWMPDTTLGRMLADYIGVTWSHGRPLVVYALASPPRNGKLRQAIYAATG